jgi:hypothetical protein
MNIIPGQDGLEVGVNIATPTDTLALDKYFEIFSTLGKGLSFVTYGTMQLGAAWAGVDIYWNEWRRLIQEKELLKMGNTAVSIVEGKIEAANKADPTSQKKVVTFEQKPDSGMIAAPTAPIAVRSSGVKEDNILQKTLPTVFPYLQDGGALSKAAIATIEIDEAVYHQTSTYFGNVLNAVRDLKKTEGAVVIGANTIFENAGSVTALKQSRNTAGVLKLAVWVKNEAAKFKALGIDEKVVTIHLGVQKALAAMESLKIKPEKIVLMNSDIDLANMVDEFNQGENKISDADEFFSKNPKLRSVRVATARTGDVIKQINAVPLALAKAVALIFDEGNVRAQLAKMVQAFKDKGLISEADATSINQLTAQLSDIPLVTVSDNIAKLQETYADTLNKI